MLHGLVPAVLGGLLAVPIFASSVVAMPLLDCRVDVLRAVWPAGLVVQGRPVRHLVIFAGPAFGMLGLVAKYFIQWVLEK